MSAQSFKVLGGKLKSMSSKEVALNYFHLLTRVKCTIHESCQEKCQLQGRHYFHAQNSIPATMTGSVGYVTKKFNITKILKTAQMTQYYYCYCMEL